MFSNPNCKKFLLLAVLLALVLASPRLARAKNGLWWYVLGNKTVVTLTLVNLTDYYLTTPYVDVTNGGSYCFGYPFVRFGVKVPPYRTASWKSYSPGNPSYMNGKMTFWAGSCEDEPDCQELDQKWSFDLNFHSENAGGSIFLYSESGTWIYLTPTHTDNVGDYGWIPSWDPTYEPDAYLFEGYLGYATRLNDGHMHNQMNLEGYELSVSMFSGGNNDIVLVVQQTHGKPGVQSPDEYVGWMLNWVDNDSDSVP